MSAAFPYCWAWRQKPLADRGTPPRVFDRCRKGERCRVLARGTMNSALVEFEDSYRVVTSRNGLRRAWCVLSLLTSLALGGCSVESKTAQPDTTCVGHGSVGRVVGGEDQDGHTLPMLVVCRDGFLVKL